MRSTLNPDFAKLADAYGILGIDVDRHDDVPAARIHGPTHPKRLGGVVWR
jgi:thiamine pyrophosphate-dependent acetolactate synthase large subunit-like protein